MKTSMLIFLATFICFSVRGSHGDQLKFLLRPVSKEKARKPHSTSTRTNKNDDATGRRPLLVPYNKNLPPKVDFDLINRQMESSNSPLFKIQRSYVTERGSPKHPKLPSETLFNSSTNETTLLHKGHSEKRIGDTKTIPTDSDTQNSTQNLSNFGANEKPKKSGIGLLKPSSSGDKISKPYQAVNFQHDSSQHRNSEENRKPKTVVANTLSPSVLEEHSQMNNSSNLQNTRLGIPSNIEIKPPNIFNKNSNIKGDIPTDNVSSDQIGGHYNNEDDDGWTHSSQSNFIENSVFYSNKRPLGSFFTSPSSLYSVRIRTTPYLYSPLMSPSSPMSVRKLDEFDQRTPDPFNEGEYQKNKRRRYDDPYDRFRNSGSTPVDNLLLVLLTAIASFGTHFLVLEV